MISHVRTRTRERGCTGHVYLKTNTQFKLQRISCWYDLDSLLLQGEFDPRASSMDNVIYPEALPEREAGNRDTLGQEMSRDVDN